MQRGKWPWLLIPLSTTPPGRETAPAQIPQAVAGGDDGPRLSDADDGFDTFGIVSGISNGHVPASYLLALAGVLFTAISYGKLVRQFPQAGSAYTYAQKSISPHVGFMVGWSSLLDYLFLPMINVLLAKIYLSALFPDVPPQVWVVTFVAILTAANLKSVNLVANFNTLFVLVQISIMVVFIVLVVQGLHKGEGVGTVWSLQPFISQNAHLIPIITGATIVCFSFLGFDAVTTLSEETPDAARVIPKAIFLTAVYGGVIFIAASFFMQLFFPDISRFKDPDAALPEIALRRRQAVPVDLPVHDVCEYAGLRPGVARQRFTTAVRHGPR